jgi:uncharacterized membrane protein
MLWFARGLLIILVIIAPISGANAATVHGTIYAWSDFEKPLKNIILEINSIPIQSKVSTDGTYVFDNLSPGNYTIKAKYFRNNVLELAEEEEIQIIESEGKFNIDLLLFPPIDSELEYLGDINLTGNLELKGESDPNYYIILVFILIAAGIVIFYTSWKKKTTAAVEVSNESITQQPTAMPITTELPEDLHELYALILKKGGRVTQKDLRGDMKCSEAKVSLMLDDLEDRGYIKKIKKGRSNIIIAEIRTESKNS